MTNDLYQSTESDYRFLCVKRDVQGNPIKIWGVYCTYFYWDWDHQKKYIRIGDALIFSGFIDKSFRLTFSKQPYSSKLSGYKRTKQKEGYAPLSEEDFTNDPVYDNLRDQVNKKMLWKILSR